MLVAVGLVAFVVWLIVSSKAQRRRFLRAWSEAAEQLGFRYDAPKGTSAYARIEGDVEGANVIGYAAPEMVSGAYGTGRTLVTTAVATTPDIPPRFLARIRRRGGGAVDAWPEVADVSVGHEPFDAAFVVETNAANLLRRILRPALMDALLALPGTEIIVRDQKAEVKRLGIAADVQMILSMVRMSSALARGPGGALSDWRKLAESVGGVLEAGDSWTEHATLPPIAVERGGGVFRIEPSTDGEVEICGSHPGDAVRLRVDPAFAADARMRPSSPRPDDAPGLVRFRVAAAPSDVEGAIDLLASSATQGAYRD